MESGCPQKQLLFWDLTHRVDLEHIPRHLLHCIRYAKQFQLQQAQHLPHFSSIIRHGMDVSMSLQVAEINLR